MIPKPSLLENVNHRENPQNLLDLTSEIIKRIRRIESENDALAAAVEIVYQALQCERVVIYTVPPYSSGKIVAEAVTPGWAQIIDTLIDDAYFQTEYIEKYQKGRAKIINDVYGANLNSFYLKNLEEIEVKAQVILPLVYPNGSLYGLLIAHQCSQARQWQQVEINLMLQLADWLTTQLARQGQYQKLENELNNFDKWQVSLAEVTQTIYAQTNTSELVKTIVDTVREVLGCDRVVIYSLQEPSFGQITFESCLPALASILGRTIEDPCFKHRYLEKYQEGRVRAIDSIYQAGMTQCYIEKLESIGVKSNLVAPINADDGEIYGLLVAHQCFAFREWQEREIWWLKQIAIQTGFGLSKARLKERAESINHNQECWENTRDMITIAKSQLSELQKPAQLLSQNLVETLNLNRLLTREVNSMNQSGSKQGKEEKDLITIISKKLNANVLELKKMFDLFNGNNRRMEKLLEEASTGLSEHQEKNP